MLIKLKLLQGIILLTLCNSFLQLYAQIPDNLVLQNTTISTKVINEAHSSITAGPNFAITATGDAVFRTGRYIYLRPKVTIIQGGKLQTILDPTLVSVQALEASEPASYNLQQNYPNPFNPITCIRFAIKEKAHVSLIVFNLLGQMVATLVNEELAAGEHEALFSSNCLASGVYVYRIIVNGFTESRRMLLLK